MDSHIRKVYVPMTETGFYILLCLREESHGYGIVQKVEEMTAGELKLSPGTMYGSLSKMEKDDLIRFVREEEKRKDCNKASSTYDRKYSRKYFGKRKPVVFFYFNTFKRSRRKNTLRAECIQQIKNNNVDEYRRNN